MAEKPLPDHVEDVPDAPQLIDGALTDEQLAEGGLVPVRTFMRTRSSANALRIQKARAKAEAGADDRAPRKQLNITAPASDDARDALKAISEALLNGKTTPAALRAVLSPAPAQPPAPPVDHIALALGQRVQEIIARGGWRARVLRRLTQ